MNKTYTISFNQSLAKDVERDMKRGKFDNTSEFFRHIYRQYSDHSTPFIIERLTPTDPDYHRSKKISRETTYTPLDQFLESLD